ncbi:hypothetical protein TTHERM_00035200 (macronuclear) [Tetrahymena thermophila SB210]|uniref:Uncharacterized protein n=1 Tax=Tetrahymena thermophila (strain SB210) TaxID=312017 RepID=Q22MK0_TETTS|nr:hypothetical protein TTHERM_00035200 [Tetrahymena thermophila SB210]EAR86412.1 hypothetical protein TTHERM_00035200 [Tetrahymena thermophila SB210]|eukprot:XP_977020.1 hypothetical protein TTHERM_00035200 [Tetrahymena thermophila SB210]
MSKKDDLTRVSAKDDDPVRKLCVRFNKDYIHTRDFKDAVAYLQLRGNGCPRKEAILFAAKNNCRVDTTKIIDGPRNYRTLQVQQVPTYMVSEGWLYGQQDYFFGSCFPSRYSETYLDYQMNNKLEENFDEQEVKMRKEYKEMIHRMKNYVKQVNQKYNFSNEQGEQLIDMVKKIVKGMKSELENRQYFVMNNIRYYDAAEAIMKKRMLSEEDKNILIEKLNVFNNYENEEDLQQVQIIKVNDDEQNEDNSPMKNPFFVGMFNNQTQKAATTSQQKQKFYSNGQSQNNNTNISYAHQLKNLECATNLLEEFEKGEGEDMPNGPQGKFDRSYANQKKKRQEQMKQNLHLVRAENQAGLEGQFNQQKYFYSKQENTFINLRKEQKVKDDLQNAVFDIYKPNYEDGYYRYIDNISMLNQYVSQPKDSKYNSQDYGNINQSTEDNHQEKDQLIDMDVIRLMKEKQDIYQKNFREKISSQAVLHRLKNQRQNQTQVHFRQTQSSSTRSREREKKTNFNVINPFSQTNQFKNNTSGLHNSIFGLKKHSSNLSLMNLSASKLKYSNSTNHLLNKFTTTPSTTIATSNNLHYKQQPPQSSVQAASSSNQLNQNKRYGLEKQSSKISPLSQGIQDQKPKSRRLILRNFNNEEQQSQMKKEILPNRTVTWSVGGEQQNQFQQGSNSQSMLQQSDVLQDHTAAYNKRKQDDISQRSNSQSLVSNIRNTSSINVSPLQNSPANKLAQQYYYQGANNKAEKNRLTQKEQLFQSVGNHQKKISVINESGFASNTIQSTNISSKAGVATNFNIDFTPKSLNVFKQ